MQSRLQKYGWEAEGVGDNPNEEKIKVYNNTNWEYEVEETKDGAKMLITDQALPEDKAISEKISGKELPEDKAIPEKISTSDESKDPLLKELIA